MAGVFIRRGRFGVGDTYRNESHVMTEAETGVMQAKDCWPSPKAVKRPARILP